MSVFRKPWFSHTFSVFRQYQNYRKSMKNWDFEWIEADCALKISILRYFAFFLELTFIKSWRIVSMVTGRTTLHCLRRPDSHMVTNEARQDLHNKKQARDTCIYLFLKTRNTPRNKKSGNTLHVWRVVTIRHHLSTPFHNLQVVKIFYFPSPPDNQKVRSTTCVSLDQSSLPFSL